MIPQSSFRTIADEAPTLTCPDVIEGTLPGQPYGDAYWPDVVITDDFTPISELQVFEYKRAMWGSNGIASFFLKKKKDLI